MNEAIIPAKSWCIDASQEANCVDKTLAWEKSKDDKIKEVRMSEIKLT